MANVALFSVELLRQIELMNKILKSHLDFTSYSIFQIYRICLFELLTTKFKVF